MPIPLKCPHCFAAFTVPDTTSGQLVVCPLCTKTVEVTEVAIKKDQPPVPESGSEFALPEEPKRKRRRDRDDDATGKALAYFKKHWLGLLLAVFLGVPMAIVLIVVAIQEHVGRTLTFNGGELLFDKSVSSDEANRIGRQLVAEGFFKGDRVTVQAKKQQGIYEIRFVILKGNEGDPFIAASFRMLGAKLSQHALGGFPVQVHLCDEYLNTVRVLPR